MSDPIAYGAFSFPFFGSMHRDVRGSILVLFVFCMSSMLYTLFPIYPVRVISLVLIITSLSCSATLHQ